MVLADLALTWLRVGLLAFGGGPAMIPFIKAECVEAHGWMTEEQFLDALALAYTLPGPLAAKMSAIAGFRVAGVPGAAVALAAVAAPPAVLMLALARVFHHFRDAAWAQGAMAAVRPAVVGMLAWVLVDLLPGGVRSAPTAAIAVAAAVALWLRVPPAAVMLAALAVGAAALR